MDPTIFSIFFSRRWLPKTSSGAARLPKRSPGSFRGAKIGRTSYRHLGFDLSAVLGHRLDGSSYDQGHEQKYLQSESEYMLLFRGTSWHEGLSSEIGANCDEPVV